MVKFKEISNRILNREWFWSATKGANRFKYITITVDTRNGICYLSDREGKSFDLKELDDLIGDDRSRAMIRFCESKMK